MEIFISFITDYGLFLAKALTILIFLILVINAIAGTKKTKPKGFIQVKSLNNKFDDIERNVKKDLLSIYNEKPIFVQLPNQITCKIEATDVALKGQTVSSSYKPAVLSNGLKIQVPPFIEIGDEVVVDTRSIEYVKKV